MKPTRIACVRIPLFSLAARLRSEPELRGESLVIVEGNAHMARVICASKPAREAGVRRGHTLAQARALLPRLAVRSRDAECERSTQDALLDICDRYSPRIEPEDDPSGHTGVVYLDVHGLTRHYLDKGEEQGTPKSESNAELELGKDLQKALEATQIPARIGIASSKLAARTATNLPGTPHIVLPGKEAEFLAPLPLFRLAPEAEVMETLGLWGIETIGQFANLSKAEVRSRLGEAGHELHLAARGIDPRPLVARPPTPTFREGMTLEWPLTHLEPFLFIARTALERIAERLQARGLGCQKLELTLNLDPHGFHECSVVLPSPTREVKTLLTLVRLDLEAQPPGAPVTGFAFLAHSDAPKLAQLSLLGPAALSPDRLATTMARLFAILGPSRVGSPREVSGHRPERFRLVEYTPPPPPKIRPQIEQSRGLLAVRVLRPPVRIEVLSDAIPEGLAANENTPLPGSLPKRIPRPRPLAIEPVVEATSSETKVAEPEPSESTSQMKHKPSPRKPLQLRGKIRVASGPWALEESWWSEDPVERDYWDIELQDGGLYRIYNDRLTGNWYADGVYD